MFSGRRWADSEQRHWAMRDLCTELSEGCEMVFLKRKKKKNLGKTWPMSSDEHKRVGFFSVDVIQ